MTGKIKIHKADSCFPDETLKDIAKKMHAKKIRRFYVVEKDKKLVGVVTTVDKPLFCMLY